MTSPRKSAMGVQHGRVQKKNNWELTPNYWNTPQPYPTIDRRRPGEGFRHVLLQRDIERFIDLLPEWDENSIGLNAVILARGGWGTDGWHSSGVVAICAWESELWREHSPKYFEEHRVLFARLGVEHEPTEDGFLCRFDQKSARAYQLLHIFLHELGHHHDRITTRLQNKASRGEAYAEAYAIRHENLIWDRYTRTFDW
jgi:hypothetical protein